MTTNNLDEINELSLISSFYDNPILNGIDQDKHDDYNYIYAFIAALLLEYEIYQEKLKLNTSERAIEYKKATDLINKTFSSQIKDEIRKVGDLLNNIAQNLINFRIKQTSNAWNISKKDVRNIINSTIEGKNYSDRIWDNKNKVAKLLKKQIKDLIDGKTSVNDIKNLVKKTFGTNDYMTDRLVDNEISRVCRTLDEQYFEDNNIQDLVYVGILDQKICENCFSHDGAEYKINDPKRPKLPLHIKCRCFYAIKK